MDSGEGKHCEVMSEVPSVNHTALIKTFSERGARKTKQSAIAAAVNGTKLKGAWRVLLFHEGGKQRSFQDGIL